MAYREPDEPLSDLPDLVGRSRRRVAATLIGGGLGLLLLTVVLYLTTILFWAWLLVVPFSLGLVGVGAGAWIALRG